MDLQLKDKVVLVSGGAKGIGRAICLRLAQEGAIPVIIGRKQADNKKVEQEIIHNGGKAICLEAELTDPDACQKVVKEAVDQLGRVDCLVNNAGFNDGIGLIDGNYKDFMESLHRNLVHYYLLAHYAIKEIIKNKGSIVNITSKTAETGQGNNSGYAAANGGRNAMTREWAVELLPHHVRVNGIVVAECSTPQYDRWIETLPNPKEMLDKINSRIPLENRMTTPEEIADTALFLLSERSSHTTGQLVYVDGGYVHLDRALIRE